VGTSSAGEQLIRINLWKRWKKERTCVKQVLFIVFIPSKTHQWIYIFLSIDKPLWFRNLFFKSEKCPSIALVVFGIFKSKLSYHVSSHDNLVFKLLYALLSFLWVYILFWVSSLTVLSLRNYSHFWNQRSSEPEKDSLSVCFIKLTISKTVAKESSKKLSFFRPWFFYFLTSFFIF